MASTLLSKTWSTVGSTTKGTLSMWAKLDNDSGGDRYLYTVLLNNTNELKLMHRDSGTSEGNLRILVTGTGGGNIDLETSRYVRDPSGWYHFVMAIDMSQSTNTNRIKFYINGVQNTFAQATWGSDQSGGWVAGNTSWSSHIGGSGNQASNYFGGSMAMVEFVDGQQLDPSYFGSTNAATGIWTPADATAISDYGTNGYKLAMDTTTPGADTSGKGNNFTVASGTPTLTQGNPQNNYATLNPLNSTANGTEPTYANGNTQSSSPSSGGGYVGSSTIGVSSGKWFWEFKKSGGSATNIYNGIGNELSTSEIARNSAVGVYYGNQVFYRPDGTKQVVTNGSNANSSYGASWTTSNVIGIALDLNSATNTVTFYKDGASQGAINLPTNTDTWFFNVVCGTDTVDTWQLNFGEGFFGTTAAGTNADGNGQGLFAYAVPSGYYALNTKNLEAYG